MDMAATVGDRDAAQRSLDELFQFARQYTTSEDFHDLAKVIAGVKFNDGIEVSKADQAAA